MSYHDTKVHGPMKLRLITTVTKSFSTGDLPADIEDTATEHAAKVNEFNSKHQVFFNTAETKILLGGNVMFVTNCLYADGLKNLADKESLPALLG